MDFDRNFIFSYLYMLIIALSTKAEDCIKNSPCSCATSQYTINLQPLVNSGGNPRFSINAPDGYVYSYEPCVGISSGCARSTKPVAVCQKAADGTEYNAGYQDTAAFSGDPALNNLQIHYTGPGGTSPVRASTIKLVCTQALVDSFVFVGEDPPKSGQFEFTLTSRFACRNLPPSPAPEHHGLSTGSILLILFFVFLAVYFIGGILFLKFVRGAQGTALVPNLEFWTVLPGLIKFGQLCCFIFLSGFLFCLLFLLTALSWHAWKPSFKYRRALQIQQQIKYVNERAAHVKIDRVSHRCRPWPCYIAAASATIHAFVGFFLPVGKIFLSSRWLFSNITIVETMNR